MNHLDVAEALGTLNRYVLPADVQITAVAALPADVRRQLEAGDGDCAVTRPLSRSQTSIVDAESARLLEQFRTPTTIIDAVVRYSLAAGVDPVATLEEAFVVLRELAVDGLLVAAETPLATPIAATFSPGDHLAGYTVIETKHLVSDTEVYLGSAPDGTFAAVKVARAAAGPGLPGLLANETAILARLAGRVGPRLLDSGTVDDRPYLVTSWCAGVDVLQAASHARALAPAFARRALVEVADAVVHAYARLHADGVLHGDVHPRNTIVDPNGSVTLVDFGLALDLRAERPPGSVPTRGGIDFFLEPEAARARLAGQAYPPPSALGEQYAIGALLYLILTGAYTHAFSLAPQEMLHQVAEEAPTPFAVHGLDALPEVERVVARALAHHPEDRWPDVAQLRLALRDAAARDLATPPPAHRRAVRGSGAAARLLDAVLTRLAAPGPLYDGGLAAPTASAMNGAAGLAYGLARIAQARDDPRLLAQADLWAVQAGRASGTPEAFYSDELEITPDVFGANSFCHHAAGVHAVQALVSHARGDLDEGRLAVRRFVGTVAGRCDELDFTFGRCGLLAGCAAMLEALPDELDGGDLRATGDRIRDELWDLIGGRRPLPDGGRGVTLGAAHGWAGYLTAVLRWADATSSPPPPGVDERLDELASLALPAGRGLRWPYDTAHVPPPGGLEASWCNGAAGYVELWTRAYRRHPDERDLQLATGAAWTASDSPADVAGDLCCGHAGRAYALLAQYRMTGEHEWLARARVLADRAAERVLAGCLRPDSLYKGHVGVAILAAELDEGVAAAMPLFGSEI